MNNPISVFKFTDNQEIRVIVIDGEPCFVAKDVCDILGLEHITNALTKLDNDEKLTVKLLQSGQIRDMWVINESGLYALIIRSTKPQAKTFRKWVTGEVLPQIRKTGTYSLHNLPENVSAEIIALVKQLFEELSTQLLENQQKTLQNIENRLHQLEKRTATLPDNLDAFVYIMHNPDNDGYKIGHSKDINARAANGRTFLPNLKIILAIPCPNTRYSIALENLLHAHFYYKRINMEWYRLEADDLIQIFELSRALGLG